MLHQFQTLCKSGFIEHRKTPKRGALDTPLACPYDGATSDMISEYKIVPVSRTVFSPRVHGFRFENAFQFSFEFVVPLVGRIDLGRIMYGLCGGMCFAALDYTYADRPVPSGAAAPTPGTDLYAYLWQRQLDSLWGPVVPLKVIAWMLRTNRAVSLLTANEFPQVRARIDRGTPAVLCLIRARGLRDPTQNHQVLATGYRLDPATNQVTIDIYDPNHPGQDSTLTMNLSDPSGGIDLVQSTGEPIRGFFVIKYEPQSRGLPEGDAE